MPQPPLPFQAVGNYAVFEPHASLIAAITQAFPATVTTTTAHNLVSGEIVRITIPSVLTPPYTSYGMQQIDGMTGTIVVTGATTFTIDIDTRAFDPFSIPSPVPPQPAQVIPIGEVNSQLNAATQNVR